MTRLLATLQNDIRLQWRSGFYATTAFVTIFWAALLSQLRGFDFVQILPSLLIGNLAVGTFYFAAALVLLEKDEGSQKALRVTPLHLSEYLFSKIVSLTIPALIETMTIAFLIAGWQLQWLLLILSTLLASGVYILVGFAAAQRYQGVSEFLLPSGLLVALLWLPLMLRMVGIALPWYIPHPLNPAFWLASASTDPKPLPIEIFTLLIGILAWILCAAVASHSYLTSTAKSE